MDAKSIFRSYPKAAKVIPSAKLNPQWTRYAYRIKTTKICFRHLKSMRQSNWVYARQNSTTKAIKKAETVKKKGSIRGAVALIIGTSIGSGILALPIKASPAGIIPSSITMIGCWGFLLVEALLLIEINVSLRKRKRNRRGEEESELDVISIRTMAQETLGDVGGSLATLSYVFLGYASMVAYTSKSGEVLFHLINLPPSLSGCLFTLLFTLFISVGGSSATDRLNQCLTSAMIGLLVAIEMIAVVFGEWSGREGVGDWGKVPATIPVIIFSLAYHDLAPVLCAYLGNDLERLRTSVIVGSVIPLVALLVWDAIALGLPTDANQVVDPVQMLMSVRWNGVPYMVEAFSLLAVGTSLIGTLLGFSEFFKEQLNNLCTLEVLQEQITRPGLGSNWWESNKRGFTAMAIVIAPTLLLSTTVPDAFFAATDIAGGYCMVMLYGVLPPAMAWATSDTYKENPNKIWRSRPALVVLALFASGIVAEQFFEDFSVLRL